MSTLPGHESWRDAGLVEDDETDPKNLVEEATHPEHTAGEDYRPGTARPDLDDRAGEADVIDQSVVVPDEDSDTGED
ncbi:hypothetical protein EXU48_02915 [Occultella glacieicola]|uniref:Uncharacterized protein n=1 Tax=Occultella glacieicola TaxID=2518684 RepID=A0ABY2E871_9MICO|nr:hypothetical protein [Occultella glacieicola]TDE97182.1 hypothetical protein EXU48_02915 [Occultella glacieicola]